MPAAAMIVRASQGYRFYFTGILYEENGQYMGTHPTGFNDKQLQASAAEEPFLNNRLALCFSHCPFIICMHD